MVRRIRLGWGYRSDDLGMALVVRAGCRGGVCARGAHGKRARGLVRSGKSSMRWKGSVESRLI